MAFRKGDKVQAGTRPEVFEAIKDEQPSGVIQVRNADGRMLRLHVLRHGVKHAPDKSFAAHAEGYC